MVNGKKSLKQCQIDEIDAPPKAALFLSQADLLLQFSAFLKNINFVARKLNNFVSQTTTVYCVGRSRLIEQWL